MKAVKLMNLMGLTFGAVFLIIVVALAVSTAADSSRYNGNF